MNITLCVSAEAVRRRSGQTSSTAQDVVFSIERAQQPSSQQAFFARKLGKPVRIDDETVELRLPAPNPLLLDHQLNVRIMSRAWCLAHGVERVPSFVEKEETYSSRNAMGTGPFMLKQREPGVKTVLVRNPNWWDSFKGNVSEVIFLPIGNDSTRTAALLAGDIDLTSDVAPQDVNRLAKDSRVRLSAGPENRVIFFGVDQFRDSLLYSSVKGRNPFKDIRVREAFYRAIDVDALKATIMRGQSMPTFVHDNQRSRLSGCRTRGSSACGCCPCAQADGRSRLCGWVRPDPRLPQRSVCERRPDLCGRGEHARKDRGTG